MASPGLKVAIDTYRKFAESGATTPVEMRAAMERTMALPAEQDIKSVAVDAGGVPAEWVSAPNAANDRVIVYVHGGGYVMGSVNTHRDLMGRLSRAAQARVLGLNYRLAPEHPCPAPVEDTKAAYRWLLNQAIKPSRIAIAGDSAGGGLVVAALVALRDAGQPLPAAGVCLSPWTDMENTGASMATRAKADPIVQKEMVGAIAALYLAGQPARTPLASPLYADLKGLPPLLIQVGDCETLLDDSTRLAERAKAAGVEVKLEVWPEMIHVFQLFGAVMPEAREAIAGIGNFVRERTA
ncbi:MAG: alpha/beta hydrolase [Candidatus Binataceae bacterium]